jgi:hypothetical protein
MADLNPMVPGDVPYPQYSVTTTEPISDTLAIFKGVVYTKDAAGRLIAVSGTLTTGIFQAKAQPLLPAVVANDDKVQVLGPRTRMIFTDLVGGLVPGEDVIVVADSPNIIAGAKSSDLYIGKVFEIYTRNTDSTRKIVSVSGDKIVVETVQA